MNYVDRAGGACLLAVLLLSANSSRADALLPAYSPREMFEKQPLELAQLLEAPPDDSSGDAVTPAAADDPPASAAASESDTFVFAGDLARQLRKIDPDARVDWTGTKLIIEANGKEFAVFPTGEEMVVDGDIERDLPALTIRNGEIYVPQAVIARIGQELERTTLQDDSETTTIVVEAPDPTPEASPTPETTTATSSILPDTTPEIATPTPRAESTESSLFPDPTPAATATRAPTATPGPTPAQTPVSEVTPFPQATPSPTPAPTPTPTPTPEPAETKVEPSEIEKRNATLSTESFKAALQDRVSISTNELAVFNMQQLEEMANQRTISRIIVHPDESGLEREDQYGKESASISLEIARRLQTQLQANGMEVILTRDGEEPVTIGESMNTITRSGAQLLVVVSVGYSTTFQDLGGFRVFYMNDSVDFHSLDQQTFDGSEMVPSELNYKPFQNMSKVLASSVTNSISASLNDRNPIGTNPVPHYLIRRAPMAATAVVVGYLSNPADAKRLTDTDEQDSMARALAEGIQNYATQVSQGKADDGGNL